MYIDYYKTPNKFDDIVLSSDGNVLTGLWFKNSSDKNIHINNYQRKDLEIFKQTKKWLDIYFLGKNPDFDIEYRIDYLTPFKEEVLSIIKSIPYGKTITYGDIAKIISNKRGIKKMSSQAVGQAVKSNPICLIVPCHRVIGINNKMVGYVGGISNKINLLELEKYD